ncbi:hypothetical protein V9T40_003458 [Parthenolecanium corni]|uniref:Uncharacterized protein n=1 Tax=Parthenolecanium corni TaxID=536013 RepID=A0AAN9TQP0_9HEMI
MVAGGGQGVALEKEYSVARENGKFCSQMIPKIGGCSSGPFDGIGETVSAVAVDSNRFWLRTKAECGEQKMRGLKA